MSKSAVTKSPTKISEKWNRNLKASVPDIVDGVEGVTEDPGAKAVAQIDKMRSKILESLDSGLWADRRLSVSMAEWKSKTIAKVKARLSTGADAAMPKRAKFDAWLVDRLNAILPSIAGMSDMTIEDSKARMIAMVDHMASQRYRGT